MDLYVTIIQAYPSEATEAYLFLVDDNVMMFTKKQVIEILQLQLEPEDTFLIAKVENDHLLHKDLTLPTICQENRDEGLTDHTLPTPR